MADARILVVDDSKLLCRLVRDVIDRTPGVSLVGEAGNGREAIDFLASGQQVDVVLLDLEMPVMDGLTALKIIRERWPGVRVLVFSSIATEGSAASVQALTMGAVECVPKPRGGDASLTFAAIRESLVPVLLALTGKDTAPPRPTAARPVAARPVPAAPAPAAPARRAKPAQAVVVGSSTGGPSALIDFLSGMGKLDVPVFIVQHIPATFTGQLARRLSDRTGVPVVEAADGAKVTADNVLLAPGGLHLEVHEGTTGKRLRLTASPKVQYVRPSADVLFSTAAKSYNGHVLGVVLTGMGRDGTDGAREIVNLGGEVLVQDEASSVVWGMPGSVFEAGLATTTLDPSRLGSAVRERVTAIAGVGR